MHVQQDTPLEAPTVTLSGSRLDEAELLSGGLCAPARGYCLPHGMPADWPAPFLLEVEASIAAAAVECGVLAVTDPDGTPLFCLDVTAATEPAAGTAYVAGQLSMVRSPEHPPARDRRITAPLSQEAGGMVAAVFSAAPQPAQVAQAMTEARASNGSLLLVAACGHQPHGNYTVMPLLRELESIARQIPGSAVGLLVIPGLDDPRDQRAATLYRNALENLGTAACLDFHGRPTAAALASRPGVPADDPRHGEGTVIFLTGLSGSGKSTVARALVEVLQHESSRPVTLLDGDDVRRRLSPGLGFTPDEREANIRRLGWIASLIAQAGGTVVCAPIAPCEQTRQEVRAMVEGVGRFLLVHVSTPLQVCESRDRKGLYAKARLGLLTNFTGIDAPYELPQDPDVRIDTSVMSVAEAVDKIHGSLPRVPQVPAAR